MVRNEPLPSLPSLIVADCRAGMGNRIANLATCIEWSQCSKVPLALYWPKESTCHAHFSELFDLNLSELSESEFKQLKSDPNSLCVSGWTLGQLSLDGRSFVQKCHHSYHLTPAPLKETLARIFSKFKPIQKLHDKVEELKKNLPQKKGFGIAYRTWKDDKNFSPPQDRTHADLFGLLDEIPEDYFFFLTTDTAEALDAIKNRYGNDRVLTLQRKQNPGIRNTKEGLEEALVEALLLANFSELILTFGSTYSQMIWWMGGAQARVRFFPSLELARLFVEEVPKPGVSPYHKMFPNMEKVYKAAWGGAGDGR